MRRLPVRQVHLDFHTSEFMENVGSQFDKKQFQEALKEGHVLIPQNAELPLEKTADGYEVVVPEMSGHQMVVFEF